MPSSQSNKAFAQLALFPACTRWVSWLAVSALLHFFVLVIFQEQFHPSPTPSLTPLPPVVITAQLIRPSEVPIKVQRQTMPSALIQPNKRPSVPAHRSLVQIKSDSKVNTATKAKLPTGGQSVVIDEVRPLNTVKSDTLEINTVAIQSQASSAERSAPDQVPFVADTPQPVSMSDSIAPLEQTVAGEQSYPIDLPPSANLRYTVRYATRGTITLASSTLKWQNNDTGYTIDGEITKFGITLSKFHSQGQVNKTGAVPVLYTEKNVRRAEMRTYFQHDVQLGIGFSATDIRYPLTLGVQDRASILWQLAGLLRGRPTMLAPGAALDITVAGVREAEPWSIRVIGEESIDLENSKVSAWHLQRAALASTGDKRIDKQVDKQVDKQINKQIDIWLSSNQQWYPVKLRYTEHNGDYVDLSLDALY
jgi:hypothetical protein